MNRLPVLLSLSMIMLSACANMPPLFYPHDDGKPDYAKDSAASGRAASRQPLEVPPELRAELELPKSDQIASRADEKIMPQEYQAAVAGKAVALDARIYEQSPAEVFSAVVDAMTSLNVPVDSVDSPSGIVTSDWIRKGADNPGLMVAGIDLLGSREGVAYTRHRFIVRVFLAKLEGKTMTRLEIRTLGQAYENNHWANKPLKRKVSDELFVAVDEQLTRMKARALPTQPGE